jgi:hypothetical protein
VLGVSAIMTTTMMMKSRANIHLTLWQLTRATRCERLPSGRDARQPLKAPSANLQSSSCERVALAWTINDECLTYRGLVVQATLVLSGHGFTQVQGETEG